VLPQRLALPWHAGAASLGRPPVLSYSSYALHNFFRFDPAREIECGNIALIQNFFGGIDEEWFILIHVDIERKAAPGLAVLRACLDAAQAGDGERVESLLLIVRASIESMYAVLKRMPEWCDPYIYYHRVGHTFTGGRTIRIFRRVWCMKASQRMADIRNSSGERRALKARLFHPWMLSLASGTRKTSSARV
jgi:indoleamine 2,3-dioxygenase